MKILSIGTGIVGTIYGWVLAEAGHEVTHFVRLGKAAALAGGIEIDVIDRRAGYPRHTVKPYRRELTESLTPDDGYDLILVAVKVYQLAPLLRQIRALTGPADYLILTSVWEDRAALDDLLPPDRYLLGDALAGGTYRDGVLVAGLRDKLPLGEVNRQATARLTRIAHLFEQAGIRPEMPENILHWKWVEYATNAGFWPALVRAGSLDRLLRDQALIGEALRSARECLEVCVRRGVDLDQMPEVRSYFKTSPLNRRVLPILMRLMFRFSPYRRRVSAHGLSDPEEIGIVYRNLLETGRGLGLPMTYFGAFEPDITGMTKTGPRVTVAPH
jgi:2-dehydropantoate 2-reductase